MFWRRKPMAAAPAAVGATAAASGGEVAPKTKAEVPPQPKAEKLAGPKEIPELAGRHLVLAKKRDPNWVWQLRSVVRQSPRGRKAFEVRVFDEAQASQQRVKIKDWTTLDDHPDLILYEGWFDKKTMQVELEEKKTA